MLFKAVSTMVSLLPSDTSNPYSLNGRLLSEITGQADGQRRMAKYIEENRADHLKAKRKRDDGEEEEDGEVSASSSGCGLGC